MASINIGQENSGDTFYRYKMPRLQAVVGSLVLVLSIFSLCKQCGLLIKPLLTRMTLCFLWTQIEGRGNGIKTR